MFRNKTGTTNLCMAAPDIAKRRDYTNKIKDESTGEAAGKAGAGDSSQPQLPAAAGQHAEEVLADWGLSNDEIEAMKNASDFWPVSRLSCEQAAHEEAGAAEDQDHPQSLHHPPCGQALMQAVAEPEPGQHERE